MLPYFKIMCGSDCKHYREFFKRLNPPLFLDCEPFDAYFKKVATDARTCWRRATRLGYIVKRLESLSEQETSDIGEIWYSKDKRQGRSINTSYETIDGKRHDIWKNKWPINSYPVTCAKHYVDFYACLHEGRVRGYLEIANSNTVGVVHSVLGHGDFLKDGIMKFLFMEVLKLKAPPMRYLVYGKQTEAKLPSFAFRHDLLIHEGGRADEVLSAFNG